MIQHKTNANNNSIKKICVIGSGVMGSGIAALIANSSHEVLLLDIASNDSDRNSISNRALGVLDKQKPQALSHPSKKRFITTGNLEDNLNLISECDLIIEVIIERLEIKHQLYQKIIPYLKEDAIIASNTSTLPLEKLKEKLSPSIKSRFLITHFFNPPRYMELLELVTDANVSLDVTQRISHFLTHILGKTIVKTNDTPGFIANRVGCFLLELIVRKAVKNQLDPVIIDKIFNSLFKLPSTGIFGLYDLIGHDVMKLISTSLITNLPENDYYKKIYLDSLFLNEMLEKKLIGRKGDGGFYRMVSSEGKKVKEVIDFTNLSYKPVTSAKLEFTSMNELLLSDSLYGKFFAECLTEFYLYTTSLIPNVTDNIYDIDLAMKLGYSWKQGPFELLNNMNDGWQWLIEQAQILQLPLPDYLINGEYNNIRQEKFDIHENKLKDAKVLLSNDSAQLVNFDNSLVFTIKTKMNCLNSELFNLLIESVSLAENKKQDLYIYSSTGNFSAGADVKFIANCLEQQNFIELEEFLKLGQEAMIRLKYSSVNIVSCAAGYALGGGCEILLHSTYIVANQELAAGLVEVGIGLIPGFGGLKEMLMRSFDSSNVNKDVLLRNINNILTQNKSSSADYFAADYGLDNVIVNMNKHYILDEALNLDLPKKNIDRVDSDKPLLNLLPLVNLADELDISGYNELQKKIFLKLQNILQNQDLTETKLLEYEREIFLELAKDNAVLTKLQNILK